MLVEHLGPKRGVPEQPTGQGSGEAMGGVAIGVKAVRVARIFADQAIEADLVADDDVIAAAPQAAGDISDHSSEDVIAAAADQPVARVVADELVIELRSDETLRVDDQLVKGIVGRLPARCDQILVPQIRSYIQSCVQVRISGDIETVPTQQLVAVAILRALANAAEHDVVASFALQHVRPGAPAEHVVARARQQGVGTIATENDVVACVAEHQIGVAACIDIVVACIAVNLVDARFAVKFVVAVTADHDVHHAGAGAGVDDVIALAAIEKIRDVAAVEHILPVAAIEMVSATAAIENVVALVPIERVVAVAAEDIVHVIGAGDDFMRIEALIRGDAIWIAPQIGPEVADIFLIDDSEIRIGLEDGAAVAHRAATGAGIDAKMFRRDDVSVVVRGLVVGEDWNPSGARQLIFDVALACGDEIAIGVVNLFVLVGEQHLAGRQCLAELDIGVGMVHDAAIEMQRACGAFDDVLELFRGDRLVEIRIGGQGAVEAIEIIKPVAIHQPFHLVFEDGVEGGAQLAAHDMHFREPADPQVHSVEGLGAVDQGLAGRGWHGVVEEVDGVVEGEALGLCRALGDRARVKPHDGLRLREVSIKGVGGDEVHQGVRMDHLRAEFRPARIGVQGVDDQVGVVRRCGISRALGDQRVMQGAAGFVERGQADVAAARHVDGAKIKGLAQQRLLQGGRQEFVHLVRDLLRHAPHNVCCARGGELGWVQKGAGKREFGDHAIGIDGVDGFAQLRMAETEGALRIFEGNVGVDVGVIGDEFRQVRRHQARILIDGDVLVFHFIDQLDRREHLVRVPGDLIEGRHRHSALIGERVIAHLIVEGEAGLGVNDSELKIMALRKIRLRQDIVLQIDQLHVMVFVPDMMQGREAEVFVGAAIARHVMLANGLHQRLADGRILRIGHRDPIHHILDGEICEIDEAGEVALRDSARLDGGVVEVDEAEVRIHVEQQRLAREDIAACRSAIGVDDMARSVARPEIVDVVPGQRVATCCEQMRAQFVQGGHGAVGQSTPVGACSQIIEGGAGIGLGLMAV